MADYKPVTYLLEDGTILPVPDPWDSCLDVDPFTGLPDHQHGDAQHEHGDGCIERECCE